MTAGNPKIYPGGNEPVNYIEKRKQNAELAEKMETIWCLKLDKKTLIGKKDKNATGRQNLFLIENSSGIWLRNLILKNIPKSANKKQMNMIFNLD